MAIPGPERSQPSSGRHSKTCRSHAAGGHLAERRTNQTIMQTGPTARHSPIGSFQRVCYLIHAGAHTHRSNVGELASYMTCVRGRGTALAAGIVPLNALLVRALLG
jgi:hypothetical protein